LRAQVAKGRRAKIINKNVVAPVAVRGKVVMAELIYPMKGV